VRTAAPTPPAAQPPRSMVNPLPLASKSTRQQMRSRTGRDERAPPGATPRADGYAPPSAMPRAASWGNLKRAGETGPASPGEGRASAWEIASDRSPTNLSLERDADVEAIRVLGAAPRGLARDP
jgi:hypothetical protein